MHDLPFADAIRPAAVSVLKLLMLNYSVGHEIILLSRRNPLVTLGQEEFAKLPGQEQRTAIIFAADACSQTWAEYHSEFSAKEKKQIEKKWADWRTAIADADYPLAIAEWRNYRTAGAQSFPTEEMPSSGGDYRYFGQPEIAGLLNFLTITCRLTQTEAFDFPLGLARMRHLAWLESTGGVRIQNQIEAEVARRREEYLKAHPEPEFQLEAGPK
jgi:hypothetical protein